MKSFGNRKYLFVEDIGYCWFKENNDDSDFPYDYGLTLFNQTEKDMMNEINSLNIKLEEK